jgi:NlpE C-terminal OB domain
MKTKRLSWLLFIPFVLLSCSGGGKQSEVVNTETLTTDTIPTGPNIFYFNGDFTYYTDAATLKDCASGATLPVAMKGEYLMVEKKYKEMNPKPMEAINCGVMGHLIDKGADEEGPQKQLLITALVGFDRTVSCNPDQRITEDVYAFFRPDEAHAKTKTSLTLNEDYSFQCSTYQLSPVELISDFRGHWFRTDKDLVVLLVDGNVLYQGTIDFKNMSLILENDSDKNVVFRRGI